MMTFLSSLLIFTARTLAEFLEIKSTKVCVHWVHLGFLTLRLVQTELPAMHQWQLGFSYSGIGSGGGSCCCVSALVSFDFLYLGVCLFNVGVSSLPCHLTSLKHLRRVVDFLICSAFYLLPWCSSDFQPRRRKL